MNRALSILEELVSVTGKTSAYVYGRVDQEYDPHDTPYYEILESGWTEKEKTDGKLGKGLYLTYELAPQFEYRWEGKGTYIVKSLIQLDDFIIADYGISRKVNGASYSLLDQLKRFGANVGPIANEAHRYIESNMSIESHLRRIDQGKSSGIIYKDRNDLMAFVSDTKAAKPIELADSEEGLAHLLWFGKGHK